MLDCIELLILHLFSGLQSGKYSVRMLSQSPVNTITLQCPEFVITYEEFKCNASVVGGSYMQVTLSWKDDSSDTFPISGK